MINYKVVSIRAGLSEQFINTNKEILAKAGFIVSKSGDGSENLKLVYNYMGATFEGESSIVDAQNFVNTISSKESDFEIEQSCELFIRSNKFQCTSTTFGSLRQAISLSEYAFEKQSVAHLADMIIDYAKMNHQEFFAEIEASDAAYFKEREARETRTHNAEKAEEQAVYARRVQEYRDKGYQNPEEMVAKEDVDSEFFTQFLHERG